MEFKNYKGWVAGLLTAFAASLCCITPLLLLLGGASGVASSFSWIEPFRPYLIGVTVFVFALAWYQKLKPQKQIDCNCDKGNTNSFWQSKSFLGIVTLLSVILIALPYYAKNFYPKTQLTSVVVADKTTIQQAVFTIKGMSCESCTQHVNSEISKVEGIITYQTSYENANSTVKFDNSKTSVDSIIHAINSTGYKVVAQTVTNK